MIKKDDLFLLDKIDRITSTKPIVTNFICFIIIPLFCKFIFGLHFGEDFCIGLVAAYAVIQIALWISMAHRMKKFLHNYYPHEYMDLYEADSIMSFFKTPLGNLHYLIHTDKIIASQDENNEILGILYSQISSASVWFIISLSLGFIFLFLFYMMVIV